MQSSDNDSSINSDQELDQENVQFVEELDQENVQFVVELEEEVITKKVTVEIEIENIMFSELLSPADNMSIRRQKNTQQSSPSIIPKKIFQTHKSIEFIRSNPKLKNAINSWRKHVPEYEYYFYTDVVCDKFMQENFEGCVYDAYKRLPLGVMKADLWRYCVIYKYGGIYADVDAICNVHPNILLKNFQLVCAPEDVENFFCQWTFAAPAGSPILKSIIDLSVDRISNIVHFKGPDLVHFLTGPKVFTDGIEKYLYENNTPVYRNKSEYVKNNQTSELVYTIDKSIFHKRMITHLFAGFDKNGWKQQRDAQFLI